VSQPPRDPQFEARIRASFARQRFMTTLGATIERIVPGEVRIAFGFREDLTQQHGFLHAGVSTAVADSACGYAALSLMEPGVGVLAVEHNDTMLGPARGDRLLAVARVVRAGRTLTVCAAEVIAEREGTATTVVMMQGTMMAVRGRGDVSD
jgi:uncharacterized protein (TIGR00369 family)